MTTCTVHEPPNPPADRIDRAERFVFVADGFSWLAAFLTPIWLLAHRLWLELGVFLGIMIALAFGIKLSGVPPAWGSLAFTALGIGIGFEAASLRRWNLERHGWTGLGAVLGSNAADCERRFFDLWLPSQPVIQLPIGKGAPVTTQSSVITARRSWWNVFG